MTPDPDRWLRVLNDLTAERDAARDEADRYRLAPYGDSFRFEALERAIAERDAARADADRLALRVRRHSITEWGTQADLDALAAHDAEVAKR